LKFENSSQNKNTRIGGYCNDGYQENKKPPPENAGEGGIDRG